VIPSGRACPLCDRRRNEEAGIITRVRRRLGRGRTLRMIPAELREPRGVTALERIGRFLLGRPRDFRSQARLPTGRMPRPPHSWRPAAPESLDAFLGARLIFFGGKGGVGKTTAAAAAAVHLARAAPDRRVLLLSTDPAHSIGDAFGAPLGDRPTHVARDPANLHAREVDAAAALASHRTALEEAFREITGAVGATDAEALLDAPHGGALMDLAPPGIDELFGMLSVVEMLALEPGKPAEALEPRNAVTPRQQPAYDLIVVDTAPTGHALRLLEIPEAVRGWVQLLMRVLLKYRSLARPGQLAADLVELSKSIRSLQALIRNPLDTRFIVVTRAAALPAAETERLLKRLRRLTLSVPAIVVNAVTMVPGRCPRCRATAAAERAALRLLTRLRNHRSRGCVIIQTPLTAPPPRGVAALDRWGRSWSTAT
jgi:arsenite-transporting ATPase